MLEANCRVWRASGVFDHSKLLAVDGEWAYVGSSNLDPRSLRLNFELDLEVYDQRAVRRLRRIAGEDMDVRAETLKTLRARPFVIKLRNRAIWLGPLICKFYSPRRSISRPCSTTLRTARGQSPWKRIGFGATIGRSRANASPWMRRPAS